MRLRMIAAVFLGLTFLLGCGEKSGQSSSDQTAQGGQAGAAGGDKSAAPAEKKPGLLERVTGPSTITIPEGTVLTVRLGEALGSKISQSGQAFSGTTTQAVRVGEATVIPSGSPVSGTVVDAQPLGRFKGGARLQIRLDSVTVNGKDYDIETASVARAQKGKGKRSAVMIGGGAGAGAVIGALAGGGKGAAIGAAVGAGAGTAGAAFTGNKNIVLPAESAVSFNLLKPVEVAAK
jgi:hypothetical protein